MTGRRSVALFLTVLMVLSTVAVPAGAAVAGGQPSASGPASADVAPQSTPPDVGNGPSTAADRPTDPEPASIGPGVSLRLDSSSGPIPILVVFDTQPQEQFQLGRMSPAESRSRMKSLARTEQSRARDLLRERRAAGDASAFRTFWVRNALAVRADEETIRDLAALPNVERIVLDRKVTKANVTTGIPAVDRILSGYNTTAAPTGIERDVGGQSTWSVEYIGADAVQERGVTGAGVNVSVVDTGIDADHPALQGQVTKWKDFTEDNFSSPRDPDGHGTHVAATIAGRRDADRAVGVAPGANLFGAKVFGSGNESGRLSTVLAAFEWSAEQNADVISASLGMPPVTDQFNGTETVASGTRASHNVTLYGDGSSASPYVNDTAYKPSYVMVVVDPVAVNGSTANASEAAAALDNVTVSFRDPNGDATALEQYSAGWAFRSGEVPDDLVVRKYKPADGGRISTTGNWSLTVQNSHGANVSYEYVALPVYPSNGSDELSAAVTNLAQSNDVLPVIAAGNSGTFFGDRSIASPGAAEGAITVGASMYRSQAVAPFSSRGPVGYGDDKRRGVTLIAPGTDVISADAGGGYVALSGTSMATPHVSGTIALMLDADPTLTNAEVRETLTATAQDVPAPANAAGAGMLDAWAAVNATNASALSTTATDGRTRELFGGIGDTGEEYVYTELDPASDPAGDAGVAPDLRYTNRKVVGDEIEIALAGDGTYNGSFVVYLDADSNDSTGDPAQGGADFRAVLNRTFDGSSYRVYVDRQRYNASADAYEQADDFYVSDGTQSKRLVEMYLSIYGGPFEDAGPAEYHVVSRTLNSSTDTDRFPNSGQLSENVSGKALKTIGIAWNSSAGQPASGVPITFEVINDSGAVIANATVLTDSQGRAIHNFSVPVGYYEVTVSDDRGNSITQSYSLDDACIEGCIVDSGYSAFQNHQAEYRDYNVEANSTVTVNIPVYSDDGNMTPYDGPASAEIDGYPGDPIVFNDLQANNGVVTFTVDLSQTSLDENDSYLGIDLALSSNFSNATEYASVGDLNIVSSGNAYTQLGPQVTTVAPGGSTTISFQHTTYGQGPANVSADYRVTWITDRTVASLSSDLPADTLSRLKQVRRAARAGERPSATLTARDKREIREALGNISTSRTATTVVTGTADPVANGVGTFTANAPVDARFGIVQAKPNGSSYYSGMSVVAIEGRTSQYYHNRTAPSEDDDSRYDLDVWSYNDDWGTHIEGDYRVPNDTYDVHVSLYDERNDTYVANATVNVYTDGGDVYTVTTDGDGRATVTVDAPNTDWVNASFDEREQQVYGIVQNYTRSDGTAITETDYLYAEIFRVSGSGAVVEPHPEVRYDDGTLRTRIKYRNETYDPVPGERTLVILNQGDYESTGDVFVGFVDPGSAESITRNFTDTTPPAPDERAEYEIKARTPSIGDNTFWVDWAYVQGVTAETTINGGFADEVSTTVTVNVTDRNGDPVAGAAVVWRYQVNTFENRSYQSTVPSERPGGVKVGTTGPDGTVTFQVAPDLPEDSGDAYLRYAVGVATANSSTTSADSGYERVEQQTTYITGRFVDSGGNGLAGDLAIANGPNAFQIRTTDADGSFAVPVPGGTTYRVGFVQQNESANTYFPRDGVTDLYVPTNVTVGSSNASVGTQTIPDAAGVLNVRVVDEDGNPVHDAKVTVNPQTTETATLGFIANTSEQGYYTVDGKRGLEANGTYSIEVEPGNATGYVNTTYTRTVTVTNDTTVTVMLEENTATVSGRVLESDGTAAADDVVVFFTKDESGFKTARTNETGHYTIDLLKGTEYVPVYYQANISTSTNNDLPRDGSADIFAFGYAVNVSDDRTLDTVQVPNGTVLNVTVVNESGSPVQNASTAIIDYTNSYHGGVGSVLTNAEGQFDIGYSSQFRNYSFGNANLPPGLEVVGEVEVQASPPANSTQYVDEEVTKRVNVTNTTNVTLTLEDTSTNVTEPVSAQSGLAYNNGTVFAIENGTIAKVDATTGEVLDTFAAPEGRPDGLAYGNGSLWFADGTDPNYGGEIVELNPETGEVRSVITVDYDPTGLAFHNGTLYVGDVTQNDIHAYSTDGTELTSFDIRSATGSTGPRALAYFDGTLWLGTDDTNGLYRFATDGSFLGTVTERNTGYGGLAANETALFGPDANGDIAVLRTVEDGSGGVGETENLTLTANRTTLVEGEDVRFTLTNESGTPVSGTLSIGLDQRTVEVGSDGTATVTIRQSGNVTVTASKAATSTTEYNSDSLTLDVAQSPDIDVTYEVSSTAVETGQPLNVTATVTNVGGAATNETVRLFVDGDAVANETVTVDAGETVTVNFSRTLARGTHSVRVNALSDTRVVVSDRVSVGFESSTIRVNTGDERAVNLTLANATNGVGSFDVRLSLANASTARITNVTVVPGGSTNVDIASDGGSARVTVYGLDTNDTGSVPLLRVTVTGDANGSTTLTATPTEISDEGGLPYIVDADASATVQVSDVPPIGNNSARPTDVDGDGKLEDLNGDGAFTVADVQTLWEYYQSDAVQSNPAAFDFNNDGAVDVVDVQKLFATLNGGDT